MDTTLSIIKKPKTKKSNPSSTVPKKNKKIENLREDSPIDDSPDIVSTKDDIKNAFLEASKTILEKSIQKGIGRILGVDPGGSTGYCIIETDPVAQIGRLIHYHHIDLERNGNYRGDALLELMEKINEVIDKYKITYMIFEDYSFNPKQMLGCMTNVAYRSAVEIVARQRGIGYESVQVSSWKKFISDRTTPTKQQKIDFGKLANKVMIQEALWRKHGLKFPNHSLSNKNNKPIKFRYDVVDVVGITTYYVMKFCNISTIKSEVAIPEDVEIKGDWYVYKYV